ncbi:hypothetical protein [Algibacter lectus]|uniref:Uncharacterized protein n=2 Tax=Algibacter lectus TaxID=221126 RepID=A0A090WYZ7_9FLAO|nr:hypothetical protein [Algibacter lectus]GAL82201.1 hypothetical protein JCM19274_4389 [Algibacter lectus]SFB92018.1 hypothetical protein SAMN04489722_101264 [Algibacter lectus]
MIQAHTVKLFNDKELNYLLLKYKGVDKEDIAKKLEFNNKRKHTEMERLILNKLSVNNLYNAYRRAFNLQLLSRRDFMIADIKKEASIVSEKIMDILFSIGVSDKEKEIKVYLALLAFQMKIEYSYLLKKEPSDTTLKIV